MVCFGRSKAVRVARDLEAYKSLKVEDSLHRANISNLVLQLSLKDTSISIGNQKVVLYQQIISDLNQKSAAQQDITNQYIKQVKVLKVERAGIIVVVAGVILKLLIK